MYVSVMFLPLLAGQWNTDNTTDTLPVERIDKEIEHQWNRFLPLFIFVLLPLIFQPFTILLIIKISVY